MTARSDELQKAAFLQGRAAFFVFWILCLEPARRKITHLKLEFIEIGQKNSLTD
jgi:hypothetical protein